MWFRASLLSVFLVACSAARPPRPEEAPPSIVFPVDLAEGHGDGAPAELPLEEKSESTTVTSPLGSVNVPNAPSSAPSAATSAAAPVATAAPGAIAAPQPSAFTADPPDPTPLRTAAQYEYTVRYENEKIELVSVRAVRYPKPIVTPRRVGRYAVELWIGHELVERVRFDFPLLMNSDAPPGKRKKLYEQPAVTGGPFTVTVLVPAAARARRARVVDRATRLQAELAWPPQPAGLGAVTAMDPPGKMPVPVYTAAPAPSGENPFKPALPQNNPRAHPPAPTVLTFPAPAAAGVEH
ncbi:MAG TPA: hypothetical protein VGQ57_06780 [Polyangiaceae bacterium]|nr:hypothetical protein [Polyangiaceae bacterium]